MSQRGRMWKQLAITSWLSVGAMRLAAVTTSAAHALVAPGCGRLGTGVSYSA
jgi:hypothetical protein